MTRLVAKVHEALDSVNRSLAEVTGMIEENRPGITDTLSTLRRTSATVERDIVEPIASELNRENTRSLLSQLHGSFEKVDGSLDDIRVISGRAKTMVVLNEERFNRLVQNVAETAAHLKSASKDLQRNPLAAVLSAIERRDEAA